MFRSSTEDVRRKKEADTFSYHHLVITEMKLKLGKHRTIKKRDHKSLIKPFFEIMENDRFKISPSDEF